MLEVNKRTPHAWQYRKLLPPPDYNSINGLKAWNRATIIEWAARTGRLPESLRSEVNTEQIKVNRGGRQAKAENLAALAAAGIITPEPEVAQPEAQEPVAPPVAAPPLAAARRIGPTW